MSIPNSLANISDLCYSILGSFGATVTIVALAMGPFAQQIVAYRTHLVESSAAASIKSATNYTAFLPGDSSQSSTIPNLTGLSYSAAVC